MVDYNAAFKRPFLDIQKLIIGCLLNLIPIVNFFALGYGAETFKMSLQKKKGLPAWSHWGDLFVTGLLMFVIGILYALPLILLLLAFVGTALTSFFVGMMTGKMEAMILPFITSIGTGIILIIILAMITIYLSPLGIMGYIKSKKLGDAFNFTVIFKKAFTQKYSAVWSAVLLITFILGVIGNIIPYLSMILGPAAGFIAMIISFTIYGEVYNQL